MCREVANLISDGTNPVEHLVLSPQGRAIESLPPVARPMNPAHKTTSPDGNSLSERRTMRTTLQQRSLTVRTRNSKASSHRQTPNASTNLTNKTLRQFTILTILSGVVMLNRPLTMWSELTSGM